MQILKEKKLRGHEVNNFASHIGDPVVRDLNKLAAKGKAYREAAKSNKFDEWLHEPTGKILLTSAEYWEWDAEWFMKTYPAQFSRELKPELTVILDINGKTGIFWNKEAMKIFRRSYDSWRAFTKKMDRTILEWDGYDFEHDPYNPNNPELEEAALQSALNRLAELAEEINKRNENNPIN